MVLDVSMPTFGGISYDRSLAEKLDEIMRLLNAIIKTGKTNS